MSEETRRSVDLERVGLARYEATNARGGTLAIGCRFPDDEGRAGSSASCHRAVP